LTKEPNREKPECCRMINRVSDGFVGMENGSNQQV
jgi:hypothetical protein